jgi:hypothetical protein
VLLRGLKQQLGDRSVRSLNQDLSALIEHMLKVGSGLNCPLQRLGLGQFAAFGDVSNSSRSSCWTSVANSTIATLSSP